MSDKPNSHIAEVPLPQPTPAQVAGVGEPESADFTMPSVENEPACSFVPGSGISTLDVYEITLMQLIEMTSPQLQFAPGTLRGLLMRAERVGQLSESARRFMKPSAAAVPAQQQEN